MRVMVIVKSNPETESGDMPTEELLTQMGNYNEELGKAGIMLSAEGLLPSIKGARIKFAGDQRDVVDGPFTEAKELIAGFWIWQVDSMEHAIEWAKKCPNPTGGPGELEIRQVAEWEDFGDELTPELQEQEARLRDQIEKNQQS
jgi:hypothetical protein